MITTHSEVRLWRNCKARHGYAYIEGWRPEKRGAALRYGTLIHAVIAAGWLSDSDPVDASESKAHELLDQEHDDATRADDESRLLDLEANEDWVRFQARYYWEQFGFKDQEMYECLGVEHEFKVNLGWDCERVGSIDLPLRSRKTGHLAVMDHKSTASQVHVLDRALALDPQTTGYLWALHEQMGCHGQSGDVLYNVIRKKAPRQPRINKSDGKVSVQAIDTLPEIYEAALVDQEEVRLIRRTSKQQELLEKLQHNMREGNPYIARYEYTRTPEQMELWRKREVMDIKGVEECRMHESSRTPNPDYCGSPGKGECPYFAFCESGQPASFREGKYLPGFEKVDVYAEELTK